MSQTFNTTPLAGSRVLVTGKDHEGASHRVIFDSTYYDELKRERQLDSASAEFDAAVEAFFAPLTDAAAKVEKAQKIQHDPAFMVVVQEAQPGCATQDEVVRMLDKGTAVLRLIEQGNTDRLLWVGDDIEVLQFVPVSGHWQASDAPLDVTEAIDLNSVEGDENLD